MRCRSRHRARLLVAAALALWVAPALAGDLVVLPFQCTVEGGRPVLMPSPDEGHRIIGPREQRTFRACSRANADECRQWTIHRFDLDCGGTRVSWASVVASVQPDRTRYESGQLFLRMPRRWDMAADDPCARGFDPADRWGGRRYGRNCADRWARAAAWVGLPPGFAPMVGTDAILVVGGAPDATARAGAPAAPPSAPAPAAAAPPSAPKVTRVEPPKMPAPAEVHEAPAAQTPGKAPAPAAAAPPSAPKVTRVEPPKMPAPAEVHEAAPSAGPPPVVPRIINRPDAPGEARHPAVTAIEKAPISEPIPTTPAPVTATSQAPPEKIDSPERGPIQVTLMSALPKPLTAVLALAVSITAVFAAFGLMRRRERSKLGATGTREFASASLAGMREGEHLARPPGHTAPPVVQPPRKTAPASPRTIASD